MHVPHCIDTHVQLNIPFRSVLFNLHSSSSQVALYSANIAEALSVSGLLVSTGLRGELYAVHVRVGLLPFVPL